MFSIATAVLATVVDWSALGKVVIYSFVVAVGATTAVSLTILGAIRFADMRRDERTIEASAFALLAVAGGAVSIAAIVAGIVVMTSK
jgi:hypothetical protein